MRSAPSLSLEAVRTCGTVTATGNTPPFLLANPSFTIPRGTPFTLTAFGFDDNGDTITYTWEDTTWHSLVIGGHRVHRRWHTTLVSFVHPPTTSPSRTFPSATFILNNANSPPQTSACEFLVTCLTGETLPATNRTMTFDRDGAG